MGPVEADDTPIEMLERRLIQLSEKAAEYFREAASLNERSKAMRGLAEQKEREAVSVRATVAMLREVKDVQVSWSHPAEVLRVYNTTNSGEI